MSSISCQASSMSDCIKGFILTLNFTEMHFLSQTHVAQNAALFKKKKKEMCCVVNIVSQTACQTYTQSKT